MLKSKYRVSGNSFQCDELLTAYDYLKIKGCRINHRKISKQILGGHLLMPWCTSYRAAKNAPNLSDLDRYHLMQDSISRAQEAGVSIKPNELMRRILYGY